MGREIRRVPKGWEHPSKPMEPWQMDASYRRYHKPGEFGYGLHYEPLYDKAIAEAAAEWIDGLNKWMTGQHETQLKHPGEDWTAPTYVNYVEYEGSAPDPESYRAEAWTTEQATCYQIYETVSEGTPVSPVFETLEEMERWLLDQGYSAAAAKGFCASGWVPSGVFSPQTGFVSGIEVAGIDWGKESEEGAN